MKKLLPILLVTLALTGCNLQQPTPTENKTISKNTNIESENTTIEKTENDYTSKTIQHKDSLGEDIFIYNNGKEIFSITSKDEPTYLYKLIDNILFVDKGTSAGNRTIIVYDLNNKNIALETQYYGELEIDENNEILIYGTMTYEKSEDSKVTCGEQEGYAQRNSFNYITFELTKIGEIYCGYIE